MCKLKKAVVDRIVDGKTAVILSEEDGMEFYYQADKLPEGVWEGDWVKIQIDDDVVVSVEIDKDETEQRKNRIRNKMDLLRKRSKKK